jgi:hypothetical protein
MRIEAVALLQLKGFQPAADSGARVEPLEDGSLLYTGASFESDPETLSDLVRVLAGEALDSGHDDSRGIFFLPSVAAPQSRRYRDVVAEVGEGGMWVARSDASHELDDDQQGFEALLGSMMGNLPSGLLESVMQAAGNPGSGAGGGGQPGLAQMGSLGQMANDLSALLGQNPELRELESKLTKGVGQAALASDDHPPAAQMLASLGVNPSTPGLAQLLGGQGIDFSSPAFAALLAQVQSQLAADPSLLAGLAEQLLGSRIGDTDERVEARPRARERRDDSDER